VDDWPRSRSLHLVLLCVKDNRMSRTPSKLRQLVSHLDVLAESGDLAAVLVHLNDTYLIEARPPHVPGLARIARLIKFLKNYCRSRIGEDTVLTLHAGDLLSPSYLSNTLKCEGRQMVEALSAGDLDIATLGNHEFDFGERVLLARLSEANFSFVLTNFVAPEKYHIQRRILWPEEAPFVAVLGIGGADVRKKCVEHGFVPLDTEAALGQSIAEVATDSRIGALVVLTHMDREEDHAVVDMVRRLWPRQLCAYVLGGHDHDMNWYEPRGNTVYLKNLANGRSVSVIPIRKSALVTVGSSGFIQYRSEEQEIEFIRGLGSLESLGDLRAMFKIDEETPDELPAFFAEARRRKRESDRESASQWPAVNAIRLSAVRAWLRAAPRDARRDHKRAFIRHIIEAIPRRDEIELRRDAYDGLANEALVLMAHTEAIDDWRKPWVIGADQGLCALREDPVTWRIVSEWTAKTALAERNTNRACVIFDASRNPERRQMDALESSLRSGSTNFGNFVCDSIRAATSADLVVVHAGSFRGDDKYEAEVTVGNLIDTFLYDGPGALAEIQLTGHTIEALYAFSATRIGSGAFLQTSNRRELPEDKEALCRVVISRYLLTVKSNDGYLDLIAAQLGLDAADAENALKAPALADKSLIDLVIEGAEAISYSEEQRIEVVADILGKQERDSILLVEPLRRFWCEARKRSLRLKDALQLLEGQSETTPELHGLLVQVWVAIYDLMQREKTTRIDEALLDYVGRSKASYIDGVALDQMLNNAWQYVRFQLHQYYHSKNGGKP
jgi:2',3'-cyclic-nucleotide 2'-phosphodiesterase (5'-nucleotidase family)